jgi:hypothetical protein
VPLMNEVHVLFVTRESREHKAEKFIPPDGLGTVGDLDLSSHRIKRATEGYGRFRSCWGVAKRITLVRHG